MNYMTLPRKLMFPLFGLWFLGTVTTPVLAEECPIQDKTSWEKCKGKTVKVTGPRLTMDQVPESFMLADPSLSGGKGFQDQMEAAGTKIVLHTKTQVECPEKMEVEGTVKQLDLEGQKVWALDVTKLTCK